MKQIITLFFVLSSFIVNAQEKLKFICSQAEKYDYFLLTNTVTESSFGDENGKYLEAWIKVIEIKKVKNVMTRTMIKFIVDCKNSRYKILKTTSYDSNGKVIESKNIDEDFEHPTPETPSYEIVKAICNN